MSQHSHNISRREEMFSVIEKYLSSGLTQKAFCQQEHQAYSTFQLWLKKYREAESRPKETQALANPGVIPLTLSPSKSVTVHSQQLVIEYPNGTIIRLSGQLASDLLTRLLQSVGA